ncbi:MAG: GTP-sensing pleiotropic transcriptional regulator CodY [Lachnospiraceae bacterium]|nr:GTP-sensing pleiotropic transcriptional regulator CodY [Lachnospiraceae bacterium]
MSIELLDKTRKINWLIMEEESDKLDFAIFSKMLSATMKSNVIIFSRRGKVLGITELPEIDPIPGLDKLKRGDMVDSSISNRIMSILSTHDNINLSNLGLNFEGVRGYHAMISPILMAKKSYGSVLIYNNHSDYSIDDIILFEHSIIVVGLAMRMSMSEENMIATKQSDDVTIALKTLSSLELKAVYNIIVQLGDSREGRIVTSKLASEIGITRSVIINALKKCESAGIIHSHSLGMKGTFIKVTNDLLCAEVIEEFLDKE